MLLLMKEDTDINYEYLVEFKYIKKEDYSEKVIDSKKNEAIKQLNRYSGDTRINRDSLKKLVIIFVGRECKEIREVQGFPFISSYGIMNVTKEMTSYEESTIWDY